jgi:hypothetical protein
MPITELDKLYAQRDETVPMLKASAKNQIGLAIKNYEKVFGLIK